MAKSMLRGRGGQDAMESARARLTARHGRHEGREDVHNRPQKQHGGCGSQTSRQWPGPRAIEPHAGSGVRCLSRGGAPAITQLLEQHIHTPAAHESAPRLFARPHPARTSPHQPAPACTVAALRRLPTSPLSRCAYERCSPRLSKPRPRAPARRSPAFALDARRPHGLGCHAQLRNLRQPGPARPGVSLRG